MRDYYLTAPKDINGEPLSLFGAMSNATQRQAIDQLIGICKGILADGVVTEQEASFFAEWIRQHSPANPIWPFTDILARIERIYADGICDEAEREEVKGMMEALCGHAAGDVPAESQSTGLPLTEPPPEPIEFKHRRFCVTGKFAFGARKKVMEAISNRGGIPSDSEPNSETHYLVIGAFASDRWLHESYGRKIERAATLRNAGSTIAIVAEEHWKRFVTS